MLALGWYATAVLYMVAAAALFMLAVFSYGWERGFFILVGGACFWGAHGAAREWLRLVLRGGGRDASPLREVPDDDGPR